MGDKLNYNDLMQDSLRTLVKNVMKIIEQNGLPGEHHFYITFNTKHPLVQLSEWILEKHPAEMTIVIQNWFEDLYVDKNHFSIKLNFGDQVEELTIPFQSIISFVDPSVEFGLKFDLHNKDKEFPSNGEAGMVNIENEDRKDAEIVSLDSFRK